MKKSTMVPAKERNINWQSRQFKIHNILHDTIFLHQINLEYKRSLNSPNNADTFFVESNLSSSLTHLSRGVACKEITIILINKLMSMLCLSYDLNCALNPLGIK
jgi:hypothetical protein